MPKPNVSAERKAQILAAAAQLFSQRGVDAARMEEIAAAAQLSIGGIYWYYKSKDELILALVDEVVQHDAAILHDLLSQPGSVQERLTAILVADMATARANLPLLYQLHGLAGRDEMVRQKFKTYFATYRQGLVALLEQGMARGELRPLNANLMATVLASFYEGVSELVLFAPSEVELERDLLAGLTLIFEGLANPI